MSGTASMWRPVALSAIAVVLMTACASGSATTTAGGDLTFGGIVGLSGIYGTSGPATQAGEELAADRVNANGGVVVAGKRLTLKMLVLDDRSDPQVALADAVQMFRDNNINILFGPLALAAISVAPVAAEKHVINISPASSALQLMGPKYPLLFSAQVGLNYRTQVYAAAIKKYYPNVKTAAWVAPNDATTQTILPSVTTALQVNGIALTSYAYPPGTTDLSTVATKVVAAKPDFIFSGPSTQEEVNVLHQLDAAGLPKTVAALLYGGEVGDKANGRAVMLVSINSPVDLARQSTPEIDALKADLAKKIGSSTVAATQLSSAQQYYTCIQLVAKAIEKANSTTDINAIAKAMTEVSVTNFGVKYGWDATHTLSFPLAVTTINGSGQATVEQLTP